MEWLSARCQEEHARDPRRGGDQPVVVRAFRMESTRTLMALEAYADTLA